MPLPAEVLQIKYRSTNRDGIPTYNITSVVKPVSPGLRQARLPAFRLRLARPGAQPLAGQNAALFDGSTYAHFTLDGIRAALREPSTNLGPDTPVGMIGDSGGAVAPTYTPEINDQIVGSAAGGIPTNYISMFNYINGAPFWGPMTVMLLIGIARGLDFPLAPYLSDYGKRMIHNLDKASIAEANLSFAGVDWASLFKPGYGDPRSIPEIVDAANRSNL